MEKFFKFRADAMLNTFNINTVNDCKVLSDWISASVLLSDYENMTLDIALQRYREIGRGWNEEELKMHFISPILGVANPNIPKICKIFFERPLYGVINNYEMNIVADCMVASPKLAGDPDKPYFFLQEAPTRPSPKGKMKRKRTDPEGQMLAAMLLAQQINADDKYLYGCYVIENNWFFSTIKGLEYCRSHQFDATKKEDLLQIVYTLRTLKELILNR